MTEATFDGFVQFIKDQPQDRGIDQCGGWDECAVGDYFREIDNPLSAKAHVQQCSIATRLFSRSNSLHAFDLRVELSDVCQDDTYGKLQQTLEELGL